MVVAELRDVDYTDGYQSLVIRNVGPTVARSLRVTFDPPIPDPDPERIAESVTPFLKRRYAAPIPVLTPSTELDNLWFAGDPVQGRWENFEPLPDQAVVRLRYVGPDGSEYDERFPIDVDLIRQRTYVTSSRAPESIAKDSKKALESISASLKKIAGSI